MVVKKTGCLPSVATRASYNAPMLTTRSRHWFAGLWLACWAVVQMPGALARSPIGAGWDLQRICSAQQPGQQRVLPLPNVPDAPVPGHAQDCPLCPPQPWLVPVVALPVLAAQALPSPVPSRPQRAAPSCTVHQAQARAPPDLLSII